MGEALISRAGGSSGETVEVIDPVAGICIVVPTLYDSAGNIINNACINCKDGSAWYNYVTNNKGQIRFSTNSGTVNLYVPNRLNNGLYMFDQAELHKNGIAAPVGTVVNINLNLSRLNSYSISGSRWGQFRQTSKVSIELGGGGGGGSGGTDSHNGQMTSDQQYGAGGGGGEYKTVANVPVTCLINYYAAVGSGGSGGSWGSSGGSGGTSSFVGHSALGGGGGQWGDRECTGGIGGNNGRGGNGGSTAEYGENSNWPSTWGGGGAGWDEGGGKPGGGHARTWGRDTATPGTRGGGGGAGRNWTGQTSSSNRGGAGGSGMVKVIASYI